MKAPILLAILLLAACGGSSNPSDPSDTPAPDVVMSDAAQDAALDVVSDATPDTEPDAAPDAVTSPPDPAAVFEQLEHPGCQPNVGVVDRVRQYRTTDVLPDLDVGSIAIVGSTVLAATPTGLFSLAPGAEAFVPVSLFEEPDAVTLLGPALDGGVYAIQAGVLFLIEPDLEVLPVIEVLGEVQAAFDCSVDGLHVLADGQLKSSTGGAMVPVAVPDDLSLTHACCSEDGIVLASDVALHLLDSDGVVQLAAAEVNGLPAAGLRAVAAGAGVRAVAHGVGATLLTGMTAIEHFHSQRWLPAEQVNDLAFDADGALWVATPAGISKLWKEEISLQDKAAVMKGHLDTWHWRLGFVSLYAHGIDPWEPVPGTQHLNDDDNDGQWTEEAMAGFCYAYQVTGDEAYYQAGRKAVEGMFQLFDVPAQDFEAAGLGFGYPARSVVRDDEGAIFDNKATQSNWHLVDHWDGHQYYWKDDTSSDEIAGHLYGLAIYHDLCAKDDAEREEVAHYLAGMIGYIMDNGYKLVDLDGEPTTHGHWAPEDLAIAVDGVEECCAEHGLDICAGKCVESYYGGGFLNSVEILGGLLAAWHVSGEERFLEAYEALITEHRYDEVATFGENVLTWTNSHMANYCDHELADISFLTLLRYEPYPARRALLEQQVLASFEYETGERNPLKSLVIASTQAEVPGLPAGMRTLLDYPADMRDWHVDNAYRVDVEPDGEDRHGDPQFATGLPYDEIHLMRWDFNPYAMAKGAGGTTRLTTTFWLLPYWGLRYHGAICPGSDG